MDIKSKEGKGWTMLMAQYVLFAEYIMKLVDIHCGLFMHILIISMFFLIFKGL